MFAIYAAFVLLAALDPPFMAQPIGVGTITLAFPLGAGRDGGSRRADRVYVARANTEFDQLTREIVARRKTLPVPVGAGLVGGVR